MPDSNPFSCEPAAQEKMESSRLNRILCSTLSVEPWILSSSKRKSPGTDMIISKTPLRMSFVGGGSDLPVFYRKYGGAVVSTAINKFVYITVNKKFDNRIRISYSRTEEPAKVETIKHPLVREALKM